jgi:hypothetical protein
MKNKLIPIKKNAIAAGFDESYIKDKFVKIKCSQCNALVLQGIACHEDHCPNTKYRCRGCYTWIEYYGYCQDCQ